MDVLTDILNRVHLKGTLYCRSEPRSPWGMAISETKTAKFHVIRRGSCILNLQGSDHKPLYLNAGDIVLLPHGHAHCLMDSLKTPLIPLELYIKQCESRQAIQPEDDSDGLILICGYFEFEGSGAHPLLSVLPNLIVVRSAQNRNRSWLESTLDLIDYESSANQPGAEIVIDRLTEALFIHVLRLHLADTFRGGPSWLSGLKDSQISQAIELIHSYPERRWTVETLGRSIGLSRTGFSNRFRELVGEPPLTYLTRWRMQIAADHLRESDLSLQEITEQVGYQAEAAFSKVFKKFWGIPPGAYRNGKTFAASY